MFSWNRLSVVGKRYDDSRAKVALWNDPQVVQSIVKLILGECDVFLSNSFNKCKNKGLLKNV